MAMAALRDEVGRPGVAATDNQRLERDRADPCLAGRGGEHPVGDRGD
jgi:hypothetical protein